MFDFSHERCDVFPYQELMLPVMRFESGINKKYMARIVEQFAAMLSHYSRVIMVRADLKMRRYTHSNKLLSDFQIRLKAQLAKELGLKQVALMWCREQNLADQQHYHLVVLANGHKVRWPTNINRIITDLWKTFSDAHHYIPKHSSYLIERGKFDTYAPAIYRASYLAKNWSKERGQAKAFGASSIKANPDKCWLGG